MVICHDQSWYIMINLQILSWKITNNHQRSTNVMKSHHVEWNIFDDLWWSHFHGFWWHFAKNHEVRSPKIMKHAAYGDFWWLIMINHDSQISVERCIYYHRQLPHNSSYEPLHVSSANWQLDMQLEVKLDCDCIIIFFCSFFVIIVPFCHIVSPNCMVCSDHIFPDGHQVKVRRYVWC